MDLGAIFEAWAPQGGPWTPWAKAILFAFAHVDAAAIEDFAAPKPEWVRREVVSPGDAAMAYRSTANDGRTAVVVDLPGGEGVSVGLALADLGFRPVPLYNALPAPASVVPMHEVVRALVAGAVSLAERPPVLHAPPAFLLDARRAGPGRVARSAQFDNRAWVFETDFPSVAKLQEAGIVSVVLIQSGGDTPASDLAVPLAKWQAGGIPIRLLRADNPAVPVTIAVRSSGFLGRLSRLLRRAMLRGDAHRGFGEAIPHGG
jgi:hypothetical protein